MVKINLRKLRGNPDAPFLAADLFMVLLVLFNLAWIVFNAMFASRSFQALVGWVSPDFAIWYRNDVQPDFLEYDTAFVAFYVIELFVRWFIAIVRGTYHRWFFYPFIHWYDVLGCIPVGSFRWLRVLRVIALLWRLQREEIIDLRDTWLVRTARKYLDIFTEEISDRVVINVLDGVAEEIGRGNPVVHRIAREVIAPRRDEVVSWLALRLSAAIDDAWRENQTAMNVYLDGVVADALDGSEDVKRLERLPIAGPMIADALDGAVADVVRTAVDRIVRDLSSRDADVPLAVVLTRLVTALDGDDDQLSRLLRDTVLESIGIVREQVSVQQWKLREAHGHYDQHRAATD